MMIRSMGNLNPYKKVNQNNMQQQKGVSFARKGEKRKAAEPPPQPQPKQQKLDTIIIAADVAKKPERSLDSDEAERLYGHVHLPRYLERLAQEVEIGANKENDTGAVNHQK